MPTIDIEYSEFEELVGIKLQRNLGKINELLEFVKAEVKMWDQNVDTMSIEIKDTSRPDLWNIEGLARALRSFSGLKKGLVEYKIEKSLLDVHVDAKLDRIRPYIGCSVVKSVKLTDNIIRGLVQMQDKLDQSYGRNRQRTSIGLYEFDLVKPPLRYETTRPTKISFVPLGFEKKMNLKDILTEHPKGIEYGHILERHDVYPILLDAEKRALSFPPIINSNDLGRITPKTENILVEVTGTNEEAVLNVLKIVTLSLIDRGGKPYAAKIHYPYRESPLVTPSFENSEMELSSNCVERLLGFKLTSRQIADLLPMAGHGVRSIEREKIIVSVPCYRIDVLHQVDLIEDVAIAYGYNRIKPLWRRPPLTGGMNSTRKQIDLLRELMIGLGFQEVLTYTLTDPGSLFSKMQNREQKVIKISNPKVQTLSCLRNWLLPSMLEFLSHNLSVTYPQRIFEIGKATLVDGKSETKTRDVYKLAAVTSHPSASFTEIKSVADSIFMNLGWKWRIKKKDHQSFIKGRVGELFVQQQNVGMIGEMSPAVLEAWNLENPVAALEMNACTPP